MVKKILILLLFAAAGLFYFAPLPHIPSPNIEYFKTYHPNLWLLILIVRYAWIACSGATKIAVLFNKNLKRLATISIRLWIALFTALMLMPPHPSLLEPDMHPLTLLIASIFVFGWLIFDIFVKNSKDENTIAVEVIPPSPLRKFPS